MEKKLERRRSSRRRVLKTAKLLITAPQMTLDAIIRDMSESGVKIQLLREAQLPAQFELLFPSEKTRQKVRLVWQDGLLAGLELIGERTAIKLPRIV